MKKSSINLSIGQIISSICFIVTITATVVTYTNTTASKIAALDVKIDNKIDSTNHNIREISKKFDLVIEFFDEKNDIHKYLVNNARAKKTIKDTIQYPEDEGRIALGEFYAGETKDMEDNYMHILE